MMVATLDGVLSYANPGARGVCPECREEVIAKCGDWVIHHWAHRPMAEGETRACSRDTGEMSEWHRGWQRKSTDPARVEVTEGAHRADVRNKAGYVIELQCSAISAGDIVAREKHWKRGCWVVDGSADKRVQLMWKPEQDPKKDNYRSFKFSNAPKLLTLAKWPVWIDCGKPGVLCVREIISWSPTRGNGWIESREYFERIVINGDGGDYPRWTRARQKMAALPTPTHFAKAQRRRGIPTEDEIGGCHRPLAEPTGFIAGRVHPETGRCVAHSHWPPSSLIGRSFVCTVRGCPGSERSRV